MAADGRKKQTASDMWVTEGGEIKLANIDRMPIHHKSLDKRRVQRKNRPSGVDCDDNRPLTRGKTFSVLRRGASRNEIKAETPRPGTPKYLQETFDYDKSSSSEENISDDGDEKEKRPVKPMEMSQKVYLAACTREGVAPRQRLVKGLLGPYLDARNFILAPEDIKAVAYALTTNMTVTSLDLSGNTLGRSGVEHLVDMLEENMTITELKLSETKIGLYEVMLLTELLSENLRIATFEAAGNNLDDECAKCFAEALKYNRRLKKLNLSNNSFNEDGGKILAKAIETNDSIEELDMSWNHIRMLGALAWGETLYKNEELRHLNLSWNGFGDEGAAAIGEALEDNTSLVTLNLANNRIGHEGCRGIAKAMGINTTLESLNLSQNPISTQGAVDLLTNINDNEESKLQTVLLEGIQVTQETETIYDEIRETRHHFVLVHSGHVMSPDTLTLRTVKQPEKKCRSSKS